MSLGNINSPKVIEPLVAVLKDKEPEVRANAANALGERKSLAAIEPLKTQLADNNPIVRAFVVQALGNINDPDSEEFIIVALEDKDPIVRYAAALSLGQSKTPRALESLIRALKDISPSVRFSAAKALGEIKNTNAVDPLINALKEKNSSVKFLPEELEGRSEFGLITYGVELPYDLQLKFDMIRLPNYIVGDYRFQIAEALGRIKNNRAVEPLTALLNDNDFLTKIAVVWALGEIKDPHAINPVINLLKDDIFYNLRRDNMPGRFSPVIIALEKINDPQNTIEPLMDLLKSRISNNEKIIPIPEWIKRPWLIELMISGLKSNKSWIRSDAAFILAKIKEGKAIKSLIDGLNDEMLNVRKGMVTALKEITGEDFGTNQLKWKEWLDKK